MPEINEEIAQRQKVISQINSDFKGKYLLKSLKGPVDSTVINSEYYATIDIIDKKLIFIERFGRYFKCEFLQESNNTFFYKIDWGEIRVTFPENMEEDLILEQIINDSNKYIWTWIKKD